MITKTKLNQISEGQKFLRNLYSLKIQSFFEKNLDKLIEEAVSKEQESLDINYFDYFNNKMDHFVKILPNEIYENELSKDNLKEVELSAKSYLYKIIENHENIDIKYDIEELAEWYKSKTDLSIAIGTYDMTIELKD